MPDEMPMSLVVKMASLVTHVQEMNGVAPSPFDVEAAKALADDPEVVAWLGTVDPVFLPVKRSSGGDEDE
jgi:hypothetical protein